MAENKHSIQELHQWQSLPLNVKILMTKRRIRDWVNYYGIDGVYISFSGGKDSTVLLTIAREIYAEMKAVFIDTGLEYPEIRKFIKMFDNVDIVKPKMGFRKVVEKYGFPLFSKENALYLRQLQHPTENNKMTIRLRLDGIRTDGKKVSTDKLPESLRFMIGAPFFVSEKCCDELKKKPAYKYNKQTGRVPITAQMADESRIRERNWLKHGCNAFDLKKPMSNPMAFWTEQDVLQYIKTYNIPIASVYGDVAVDYEGEGQLDGQMSIADYMTDSEMEEFRLDRPLLKTTGCNRTGCVLCGFGCLHGKNVGKFERLHKTHPGVYKALDVISNNGVTYREAIDWINEHNGKGTIIRY